MSELPMRGHFRYLRFKTFSMTPRTPQCEVFCPLLSSSKHSGVPEDSQPPTFPSVGLHPHTWPKWGCDSKNPSSFSCLLACFAAALLCCNTASSGARLQSIAVRCVALLRVTLLHVALLQRSKLRSLAPELCCSLLCRNAASSGA